MLPILNFLLLILAVAILAFVKASMYKIRKDRTMLVAVADLGFAPVPAPRVAVVVPEAGNGARGARL